MKRFIKGNVTSATSDVRTYQNRRNENKFIETKKYKDGHSVARQYMRWDTPEGEVKNYTGSKSNRGRWFRAGQHTRDMMLDDYDEVVVDETVESATELDDRFAFSFDEIGDEIYIDARVNYAPIYLEDEQVIGNGAGMQYDVIVAIPRDKDHWQMKEKILTSLDEHVQSIVDGTDYYGGVVAVDSHPHSHYANIPDDVYKDSVLYSATIEVVPYANIGPDGEYGIDYAYDYE